MKLIALKRLRYDAKMHDAGEEFVASDRDASVLITVRLARNAEDAPAIPKKRAYKRRDLTADKPKRAYRRRDLTAEGT